MKISNAIKQLRDIQKAYGDLELTCTGSTRPDAKVVNGVVMGIGDVFETTVENFIVNTQHPVYGKRVRVYM